MRLDKARLFGKLGRKGIGAGRNKPDKGWSPVEVFATGIKMESSESFLRVNQGVKVTSELHGIKAQFWLIKILILVTKHFNR